MWLLATGHHYYHNSCNLNQQAIVATHATLWATALGVIARILGTTALRLALGFLIYRRTRRFSVVLLKGVIGRQWTPKFLSFWHLLQVCSPLLKKLTWLPSPILVTVSAAGKTSSIATIMYGLRFYSIGL